MLEVLKAKIRDIPDFPQPGILFKDITPLLGDPQALQIVVDAFAHRFVGRHIDYVVGIEARGFVLGAALAYRLNAGFVMVRKAGKLPAETLCATYDLEYGQDELEIHRDAVQPGSNVVLVDDVIATGGTACAVAELLTRLQCNIVELDFLIELSFLNGRERLQDYRLFSLLHY
jgi:adenine phosphoribosyltransferase